MNTKDFIQSIMSNGKMVLMSKTSIALVSDIHPNGTRVTMKEKNPDGSQVVFDLTEGYGAFTGRLLVDVK